MAATSASPRILSAADPRRSSPRRFSPPEAYVGIDLDGVIVDSMLEFHLYLHTGGGRFVLFRSPSLEFSARHRQRLLDNGVKTLYLRADERGHYQRYLENNIGSVLKNAEVPPRKKASMLYAVSRNVVESALTEPRSSAIVPRTRHLATETMDYVLRDDRALVELASLMATDYYTYTHSINVAVFSVALAHRTGVSREDLADFATGSLLHDIGKTEIPTALITRQGPLTTEEMRVMRQHVLIGERLLTSHQKLNPFAMLAVKQHHEKVDGSGYPRNLQKEQVHLFGRIACIADCFDAMTTNRSYQQAMKPYDALLLMRSRAAAEVRPGPARRLHSPAEGPRRPPAQAGRRRTGAEPAAVAS